MSNKLYVRFSKLVNSVDESQKNLLNSSSVSNDAMIRPSKAGIGPIKEGIGPTDAGNRTYKGSSNESLDS